MSEGQYRTYAAVEKQSGLIATIAGLIYKLI